MQLLASAGRESPGAIVSAVIALICLVFVGAGMWTYQDPDRWRTLMFGWQPPIQGAARLLSILWIVLGLGASVAFGVDALSG